LGVFGVQFSVESGQVGGSVDDELFGNGDLFLGGVQLGVQVGQLVVGFVDGLGFFDHVGFEFGLSLFFGVGVSDQSGSHVLADFVQFVDNSLNGSGVGEFSGGQGDQGFDEVSFDVFVGVQFFGYFVQSFFGFFDLNE
jgi:hypothetical protein